MRVVLDTNVLLSVLISASGVPNAIYMAWRKAHFDLVTSTQQLDELRRASRYPKLKIILPAHRIGAMTNNMQRAIVLDRLFDLPKDVQLNDSNDAFLVAMALTGEADFLVTGDRRAGLLQLGSAGRAKIVTPADFCAQAL